MQRQQVTSYNPFQSHYYDIINVQFCYKYIKLSNNNVNKIIIFDSKIKHFEISLIVYKQNRLKMFGRLIKWLVKQNGENDYFINISTLYIDLHLCL